MRGGGQGTAGVRSSPGGGAAATERREPRTPRYRLGAQQSRLLDLCPWSISEPAEPPPPSG